MIGIPAFEPSTVNCTVPVGAGEVGVTVAVKFALVPTTTDGAESISVVVVEDGRATITELLPFAVL